MCLMSLDNTEESSSEYLQWNDSGKVGEHVSSTLQPISHCMSLVMPE